MAGILIPTITAHLQHAFDAVIAPCVAVNLRPAEITSADLQTNDALRLGVTYPGGAKALAEAVAARVPEGELHEPPWVSGPGYLNVRLRDCWLARHLVQVVQDDALSLVPPIRPRRVLVDYSSPNVAKRMHVGHLRSTILGDALVRVLRRVGHEVLGDNHVGDWGTQFGLLLWGCKALLHRAPTDLADVNIDTLEELYRNASTRARADPEVAEAARRELVALQQGDPQRLAVWERFVALSRHEAERLYARLDVRHDLWLGESYYNPMLPGVVARLRASGLAEDSEGAVVVRFPEGSELASMPFLVEKSDGGYLYATTDVATVIDRIERLHAEHIIYVVDVRQALHFRQLFTTARLLGYDARLDHVGFGMMLGADGRPFRTRDGGTVTLEALLDEAEERVLPIVRERWPDASPTELHTLAACIGVSAIKYADLSMSLATDYRFDWERMLSAEGDTGPYLLYGLVRLRSLLRRADSRQGEAIDADAVTFATPIERRLAVTLARFGDVLDQTAEQLRPHVLCNYLHGLVKTFSNFYHDCPVLDAPTEATRASRLLLVRASERVLAAGLECLNLPRIDRM